MTLRKIAGLGALLSLVTPGLAMADEAVLEIRVISDEAQRPGVVA